MSAIFGLRRSADEDGRTAGGKIVRSRRTRAADKTPYARPQPAAAEEPVPESSGNPNWISGLIHPARAIACGAGRILSAVFGPDSLSSSSSSSSSGGDCYSEDEDDASDAADVDLNKVLSSMNTKSENVHLIQQLVMQQTFSREECDELIKLIRSRVVKWDWNLSNTEIMSGACNNAVMEARKWLAEKKATSGSKLMVEDHGPLYFVTHGETGSPVDVAKSYMEAQPTRSSPAVKHVEFTTPSPVQNSKAIFHSPVQLSEMEGSALSTESWNILNEIRRVRSKATEELLAKTPSTKISLASASLEDKSMQDIMKNNVNDGKIGDKLHSLTSLTSNSDRNASLGLPATKIGWLPESGEINCERPQGGALQTDNASLVPKQCQDGETIQTTGDSDAANKTDPVVNSNQLDGCHLPHEMNGLRDSATKDHALSISVADQTLETRSKETIDAVDSSKEKAVATVPDNLQLQNEHSNHTLHADDNDRVLSGLQDTSSMQYEDSLQDATQSEPNHNRKDAPPGKNLRPRTKRGRGNII